MTYCVGVKLEEGLILASDSRTHAGVDNYAKFCKMSVFEKAGDRVLVLLIRMSVQDEPKESLNKTSSSSHRFPQPL